MAYDKLCERYALTKAAKEHLRILQFAAQENKTDTDDCLHSLIDEQKQISADKVAEMIHSEHKVEAATVISLDEVSLRGYDQLVTMEVAG
ncbi:MAG: hypothetical protein CSA33_00710 [Desulfobulbus propionicus]|nr:MAG: hypothetical protein CSA33_00710 [Desulfobulbus propionicus]